MASEFTPAGSKPRMTKAQVRKYLKDMEELREKARKKLEEYENSGELQKDLEELENLEKKLDEL